MADDSSLSPGVVRDRDGTSATVDGIGLHVAGPTMEELLEELLVTNQRMLRALVLMLNDQIRGNYREDDLNG